MPIQLLINPAINQDLTAMTAKRFAKSGFDIIKTDATTTQNHENNSGVTAGDGPGAKGLSQGNDSNKMLAAPNNTCDKKFSDRISLRIKPRVDLEKPYKIYYYAPESLLKG